MIKTVRLFESNPSLIKFNSECERKGFKNNINLKSLRWDWCLDQGAWHATYYGDNIIALSGIHSFLDGYRSLYRGAQLFPCPINKLNRYQMQSWPIYAHLPLQLEFAGTKPVYITTNVTKDNSGKMNRVHNSFKIISKSGMIKYVGDDIIFNTLQSIWQVNPEVYFEIRSRFTLDE